MKKIKNLSKKLKNIEKISLKKIKFDLLLNIRTFSRKEAIMQHRKIILRIVVVALLIYSFTAFGSGLKDLRQGESQMNLLEEELSMLKDTNSLLKAQLSTAPDEDKVRKLAREKLGMLRPEDKIFIFSKDREELLWGWK